MDSVVLHSGLVLPVARKQALPKLGFGSRPRVASRSLSAQAVASAASGTGPVTANGAVPLGEEACSVGKFMTRKENLHVLKSTTTIDRALEMVVEYSLSGFPVIDDNWKLVGVVSDYDLLALDSISGNRVHGTGLFPEVNSSWKTFFEIQKLLSKTNGKVIGDVMTAFPLVVHESSNLKDAARILLETKYGRLPVVDAAGKLIGMITRENVVRAALENKREKEKRIPAQDVSF